VLYILPPRIRYAFTQALLWTVLVGLVRDLIMTVIRNWGPVYYLFKWMFATSGLTILGAVILFILIGGLQYCHNQKTKKKKKKNATVTRPKWARWAIIIATGLILILLPTILGQFFSEILDNVGLFILMGLGLNIVVGFAGLLDLGYVAFYAIGAYMMGVLTSPELTANPLTYWQALPITLGVCFLSGLILGLPVLKMRGDYLAIVTLGFGEIVRLLVLSDWLRPWLGGSQGIQHIAHPVIGPIDFGSQQMLYYVILVAIAITGFIAWRLKDSRLGRAWMALREDEDVATAMGINNVVTKLLAFATGAFFAGLSGTLYAAKLSSAYPQSFQFLVSINVISLIIIGGIGSIPGVVVGGLVLMGLPEVLREFAEYRYLVYGAVLVFMMLTRPEGLWPEERRKLELHEMDEITLGHGPPPLAENPGERK
jgi:branched-chain amino acid transport system permease protein